MLHKYRSLFEYNHVLNGETFPFEIITWNMQKSISKIGWTIYIMMRPNWNWQRNVWLNPFVQNGCRLEKNLFLWHWPVLLGFEWLCPTIFKSIGIYTVWKVSVMMHEAIIAVNRVNILGISVPLFIFLLKLIISVGLLLNSAIEMNE